uniref:Uncharacterized protein n=1 Tax=Arundo donax TaxID=35708 RepID=A0A0A9HGI0_ARUDO
MQIRFSKQNFLGACKTYYCCIELIDEELCLSK